jgi:hypothetical protein
VAPFIVGFIVGASVAGLLAIVLWPSRKVREEQAIPRDDVTKLLLGEDPDDRTMPPSPPEHDRAYDAKELQALRNLDQSRQTSRRRK